METKTVKIPNIGCDGCVNTIKDKIGALPGVKSVEGSPQTQTITLQWEQPADWTEIQRVLASIDYAPAEA